MALFGLFGRKDKGYASPWLQLTVVYATAKEGLQPDAAFALRGKMLAAHAIEFEFTNPGNILAFYPGTVEGQQAASRLADVLREVAREKSVPAFGVGVETGECLAQLNRAGRFVAKPLGVVISQAMELAHKEADRQSS